MFSLKLFDGKPIYWPCLIALLLSLGILFNSGAADAESSATPVLPRPTAANDAEPPYTDGFGLLPKLPAFTAAESAAYLTAGKQACDSHCVTHTNEPPRNPGRFISWAWADAPNQPTTSPH